MSFMSCDDLILPHSPPGGWGGGQAGRNDKPLLQQGNREPRSYPGPSHGEKDSGEGPGCCLADTASSLRSLEKAGTMEGIWESQETHPLGSGYGPAT